MLSPARAVEMVQSNGFDLVGCEFLPYRSDAGRLMLPRLRALVERHLAGHLVLNRFAESFVIITCRAVHAKIEGATPSAASDELAA